MPCQHPGEALSDDGIEQRPTFTRDRGNGQHLVAGPEGSPQLLTTTFKGLVEQGDAVEVQEVKGQERHGPARLTGQPAGQFGRIRRSGRVRNDELAIQHRGSGRNANAKPAQFDGHDREHRTIELVEDDIAAARFIAGPDDRENTQAAP